ncbi:hypothetical protein FBZ89_106296 [Nitrospirillum amazonense]|uniref:Aspartyl protease n=1 Tax=Nitrospirillum amazonense TaxID=28077 RepID=A0A560FGZ9_9PROT|nr:hypothetical protein [Nitrospirillum amazonense]TWB20892.1 hypothetical protein FBZ89_106296 [Nitrospirillum amazonense]
MSLLFRSPRRLLAGALIAMGLAPVARADGSTPDYSAYTTTVLIPFIPSITQMVTNPDGTKQLEKFVNAPSFHVRIGTKADAKVHTMDMDTGSTGVMLPIGEIVGYTRDQVVRMEKGWEFLSSDNLLSIGYCEGMVAKVFFGFSDTNRHCWLNVGADQDAASFAALATRNIPFGSAQETTLIVINSSNPF